MIVSVKGNREPIGDPFSKAMTDTAVRKLEENYGSHNARNKRFLIHTAQINEIYDS